MQDYKEHFLKNLYNKGFNGANFLNMLSIKALKKECDQVALAGELKIYESRQLEDEC